MKAIIFDLDNTLIDWIDEYNNTIKVSLEKYLDDVNNELVDLVNLGINEYDKKESTFTKEGLLKYINRYSNLNLPIEFVDMLESLQCECANYDEKRIDVIKYLSQKYDLYLISNWFTKTQEKRLEKAGILRYFKKVYGADSNYFKPDKRAFKIVTDIYGVDNCISIGDSLKNDIEPCAKMGMRVIWKNDKSSNKYTTIKNIYELKEIL